MLQLRPNCECCDKALPATATDACICSYECTFCQECVDTILSNVCPNCGGGFCSRPIRPAKAYRTGVSLLHQPAANQKTHTQYSQATMKAFAEKLKHIPSQQR